MGHVDWDIEHKTADEWTALQYAAMNGQISIVKFLLGKGADINTKDKMERTPLHWACRFNNEKVTELLVEYKPLDPKAEDKEHNTPLDLANRFNKKECYEILKKHLKKRAEKEKREKQNMAKDPKYRENLDDENE